jgi:CubicO group peptidase (beta-lactamase class C family)
MTRSTSSHSPDSLLPAPPSEVPPLLNREKVDHALDKLDGLVQDPMSQTGVPGIAVAVVYQDRVVYTRGFGVREAGKPARVTPATVFQLASVSKPLASTVVGVDGKASSVKLDFYDQTGLGTFTRRRP